MGSRKARALHVSNEDGDAHAVVIQQLRVLVNNEDGMWNAQGVEIDYAACGESLEDVQRRFENGLSLTIHAHLERFGTIDRLLKWAPERVWGSFSDREEWTLDLELLDCHDFTVPRIPYKGIAYLDARRAA